MKTTSKYVGLDTHQASIVATVREDTGRVIARSVMETHGPTIVEYFRGMRGAIHVAFEEGTQSQWLHDLLEPLVQEVVVSDMRQLKKVGNHGDEVDADWLSELLRLGGLHPVYKGSSHRLNLVEYARTYENLVEDGVRVMQRIKALFRANAIPTEGQGVYGIEKRTEWMEKLPDKGVQFRLTMLYAELDVVSELRPKAKAAMVEEAQRDPAWKVLNSIKYLGEVRVSLILAIMKTPWRFRTKRNVWSYAGLAVVTVSSADHKVVGGKLVRKKRPPMTRGLNRNHNHVLKDVFKGAATAAAARPGPMKDFYDAMVARGMREEMATLTLARKIAALTLRLWKKGELYDPEKLTLQST